MNNYSTITDERSLVDGMVPSQLEQALLLTNLFEDPPNLLQLGFDHYVGDGSVNKSDSNNHFLSHQDPALASPWWTIQPIENQPQPSSTTTAGTSSLFTIELESDSNHGQQDSQLESNEPVKTISGPDILDPTLEDHLPLQSTFGQTASNLIESWIDFTGGGSGSTSELSPIIDPSPAERTETSITIPSPSIHHHHETNALSSTPRKPEAVVKNPTDKPKAKKSSKRRISPVSTISASSVTSTCSASSLTSASSSSSSSSAFSPSSIAGGARDPADINPRKTKTNKRNEFLERNRLAACRSRAKKKSYQRHLEEESQRLESEQIKLHQIIQDLIVEKENLKLLVNQKFDFLQPNNTHQSNSNLSNSLPNDSSSF